MRNRAGTLPIKTMDRVKDLFIDRLCLEYKRLIGLKMSPKSALVMLDLKWADYMELYSVDKVDILKKLKEIDNG